MDTPGFAAWKARRAAKTNEDEDYGRFVDAMSGTQAELDAGVARHLEPGGPDPSVGVSDDAVYQGFVDQVDGTAGRRRAQETVRREREERQEEHKRHSRQMGYPLPTLFED